MNDIYQVDAVRGEESLRIINNSKKSLLEEEREIKKIIQKIDNIQLINEVEKDQIMANLNQVSKEITDNMIPFLTDYVDTMKLLIENKKEW